MNNILVGKLIFEDEEVFLDECNLDITIKGHVIIKDINNKSQNNRYIINLCENSILDYYKFDKLPKSNINLIINSSKNSSFNYHYSFIANDEVRIDILNNIDDNDIKSNIIVKGITHKKGKLQLQANANIKHNTHNNAYLEDIKILKLNDLESVIKPLLCVSSNDITASHNATCQGINKNELFYLMSKGISKAKAKKIIRDGFLKDKLLMDIDDLL